MSMILDNDYSRGLELSQNACGQF